MLNPIKTTFLQWLNHVKSWFPSFLSGQLPIFPSFWSANDGPRMVPGRVVLLRRLRRAGPAAAGARAKAAGATTAVAADARGLGAFLWILMGYLWDLLWHFLFGIFDDFCTQGCENEPPALFF
jgi:hypothetical protein